MTAALTAPELSVLFGLDEKRVRKEIEHGIIARPSFGEADAVYFRTLSQLGIELGVGDRQRLHTIITDALAKGARPARIALGAALDLKLGDMVDFVRRRLAHFDAWKAKRVVADPDVLAGEPVFKGTRLSIRHVGTLLSKGQEQDVREDYPYLTNEDLEFAFVFSKAYPQHGRPRERQTSAR